MMLTTWIYVSTSRIESGAAERELDRIVDVSRIRNASIGVTGALLFTGERFAQCIEGSEDAVRQLRVSIMDDARHHKIYTLTEGDICSRYFIQWSLAYAGPATFVSRQLDSSLLDAKSGSATGGAHIRLLLQEFVGRD